VNFIASDGTHTYNLAERLIDLPTPARPATGANKTNTLTLRLVAARSPDGHQTPILTNRSDFSAPEIAYRMGTRWRRENYFNCADLGVMPISA